MTDTPPQSVKLIVDACVWINCFQGDSPDREASLQFLNYAAEIGQLITMPSHGWFEIWSNLNKLSAKEKQYLPPVINGRMALPVELIHIDDNFIQKYGNVRIPYIKAADHIYIVIAYVNQYPLVTTDKKMYSICRDVGVKVFRPDEYVTMAKS